MTRLMRFSLIMMLGLSCAALAQTPTASAPWPPDPNAIFAEGVEWALVETMPEEPITIDREKAVIRVRGANNVSREYPFPDKYSIYKAVAQPDGFIRVYRSDDGERVGNILLLNTNTGLYEGPLTSCRGQTLQDEPERSAWIVIQLDSVDHDDPVLCHTATSEERDALPKQIRYWWSVDSTPDPNRLILSAYNLANYQIFAYDLNTNELTTLGVIDRGIDDEVFLCDWITDTQGVYCARGTHYEEGTGYYSFDISKPDSLNGLFYGWNTDTFHLEDPTRYIHVSDYEYSGHAAGGYSEPHPCTLSIYDANGLQEIELGERCLPIPRATVYEDISPYHQQDDHLYFLVADSEDATETWLTHYDITTETISQLAYPMEMESILSVSPDHRYIVVLMDDNGVLDFPWQYCCNDTHGRQVAIMDTQNESILYQSEPLGVFVPDQVIWTSNTTLSVTAFEFNKETHTPDGMFTSIQRGSSQLIHLGASFVIVTSTVQYSGPTLDISPNLLYGLHDNTLIDLRSFETVSIFQEGILEDYSVRMRWDEETGDLVVYVSLPDDSHSTEYRVVLPNGTKNREILK